VTALATAVLSLRGASRRWPGGGGLAPVSLDLHRGELCVVRGRSGSGKSTLLALVAGWCEPDAGEVRVLADRSWSHLAVLPQVIGLTPELSVRENVELPLRLAGVRSRDRRLAVDSMLADLDVADLADRLPREVSMGQRQRVALARALVVDPTIALVDEPTSHQDGDHATTIVAALRRAAARGSALLVATHDPAVIDVATAVVDLDVPG
jgi:putative ABC transport system ATP-binding protein